MSAFDPNSNDAMFAKVLAKLDEHGTVLVEIRESLGAGERRLSRLEGWKDSLKGKITVISVIASAAVAGAAQVAASMFTGSPPPK